MSAQYPSQTLTVPGKPRPNPSATSSISYTPTDTSIPPKLYDKVPNLDMYKKLKDAERQIDLVNVRKGLDFQSIHSKSIQPSNFPRETGILRVFIYNTCSNQPWQKQLAQERGDITADNAGEPSWTLRVEGKLLRDDKSLTLTQENLNLKFSSFLSGLSVDLVPNDDYPEMQAAQSNIIEWRDASQQQMENMYSNNASNRLLEYDGLDVKRNGMYDLEAKIALLIKSDNSRLGLSPEMAQFIGKEEATQQELLYAVWQYALFKRLFKWNDSLSNVPAAPTDSSMNGMNRPDDTTNDLTVVECDEYLSELLKVPNFRFTDLYKLLYSHFKPRKPIILDYTVNTKKSTTLGDLVVDIPVELPLSLSSIQKQNVERNKQAYESLTKSDAEIQTLNHKIALGVVALQQANYRENFYRDLSSDPVNFMKQWVESQLETLRALKSDEGFHEQTVRRADYYEKNDELLKEKIDIMLGANRI